MFERDERLIADRVTELRAAAAAVRPLRAGRAASIVDRARRSLGATLIAVGAIVAGGVTAPSGSDADERPCDDCGVPAAA